MAIRSLKNDTYLIILPADKGCVTIVLEREAYDSKLWEMLNDQQTYKTINSDPAPALKRKMKAKLLSLNKKVVIPDDLYRKLCSSNGTMPLLYRLPKIHKAGAPLKPIVSFLNSPTYQLSKHLLTLLALLVGQSSLVVHNSRVC